MATELPQQRMVYLLKILPHFVILENKKAEEIAKKCTYSFWERLDSEHIVARFATSWATADSDIDELRKIL